jgi:hypothetical protein
MPICSTVRWANWHIHISSAEGYTNMTFCILCGINSNHSDIKNYHQIICHTQWWHHRFDSDDMEYTEDAIDNMILEFSGD